MIGITQAGSFSNVQMPVKGFVTGITLTPDAEAFAPFALLSSGPLPLPFWAVLGWLLTDEGAGSGTSASQRKVFVKSAPVSRMVCIA